LQWSSAKKASITKGVRRLESSVQHIRPAIAVHSAVGLAASVAERQTEQHARGFSSSTQFVAMLFYQLGHAQSLREITQGLAASEGQPLLYVTREIWQGGSIDHFVKLSRSVIGIAALLATGFR